MALKKTVYLLLAALILVFTSNTFAAVTGKIAGRVIDSDTGEGLPAVNVTVVGTNTGAATDIEGYYTILNIPPGTYSLFVSMIGYGEVQVQDIKVNSDRTTTQNISLSPEALKGETVTIMAERPIVEMGRTNTASYVNSETIESLPVTSMNEIVQLQAGVVTGADGKMHFRGGRAREVAYLVDGVPVSNSYSQNGGSNTSIATSMINELQVISGTFNAEYGAAQSGVINVITKRPEKEYHGSFQLYSGDYISNKTNTFIGIDKINPIAEYDFQGSVTGPLPIFSNKLGFLLSARVSTEKPDEDEFDHHQYETYHWYDRRFNSIDGWKIATYRRWYTEHFTEQGENTGEIYIPDSLRTGDGDQGPLNEYLKFSLNGKLIYEPTSSLKFTYSLFYTTINAKTGSSSSRYAPDNLGESWLTYRNQFFNIRHVLSTNFFYNLNLSYQYKHGKGYYRDDNYYARYPGDEGIQPFSSSANGFSLGATGGGYSGRDDKNFEKIFLASGDFNWQIDRHNLIKAGFEVKQHFYNVYSYGPYVTDEWDKYAWDTTVKGSEFTWPDYWDHMVDYWKNWEEYHDGAERYRYPTADEITRFMDFDIKPFEAAVFIQDKLEMGEMVLNAGLRLDYFDSNENVLINERKEAHLLGEENNLREAKTQYQLSPRLGFSFPISDRGAFHVAYGHFFQMPSFSKMYAYPLKTIPRNYLSGLNLGNAELEPERTIAYEIGLQQGLTDDYAVDVTMYYKDFRNLLGSREITTLDLIGYYRNVNRDYGNVKGFTVALKKLGQDNISGSLDYTYQYTEGSSSSTGALAAIQVSSRLGGDPVEMVERQVIPLDWDQRHTVNATLLYNKPGDWSASVLGWLGSGEPYTPSSLGQYAFPDNEFNNSEQKPLRWNVDLKLKKQLKLGSLNYQVFLNIENIFDHLNELYIWNVTGQTDKYAELPSLWENTVRQINQVGIFTPDEVFNRPTWYGKPRRVQLGVGFNF